MKIAVKIICWLSLSLLFSTNIFAQVLGEDDETRENLENPDFEEDQNHFLTVFPHQWVDMTASFRAAKGMEQSITFRNIFLFNPLDESADQITLGFTFNHYGETYTRAFLTVNGFMALGTQDIRFLIGPSSYSPGKLPSPRQPNTVIAPFWADLDFSNSTGWIFYKSFKPDKTNKEFDHFICEWNEAGFFETFSTGTYATFQLVLFPNGGVLFQYRDIVVDEELLFTLQFFDLDIDDETSTFQIIRLFTEVVVGYESKGGLKGVSWDNDIVAGMSIANQLIPEWVGGVNGENFLDRMTGRDRRNQAVTGSGSGGCFIGNRKAALDR